MDPYLEARWSGFHLLMISAAAAVLKRSLPPGLEARPQEDVRTRTVAELRLGTRTPDVAIVSTGREPTVDVAGVTEAAPAVTERVRLVRYHEPVKIRRIEIVDARDGDRLVTAVELLSPSNKAAGDFNRSYRKKLKAYEDAGVNWVEIDLLRSTRKRLAVTWDDLPHRRKSEYLAVTSDAATGDLEAYPIRLRSRLPTIDVPLRRAGEVAPLDLQAVFDRAWDDGPFENIDYTQPADPPLSADDAAWLAGLLAARTA